jgi:putative sterol carrier protein
MTDPSQDQPDLDAAEYAALVRDASDEDLAAGLRTNRALILERVFGGMAEHLDRDTARDAEAVIEWHITGRDDGGYDQFQVVVRRGTCMTARDGDAEPDVVYTIDGVDFLRLVTDSLSGPELFMTGRLLVEGDLMLGAMTQTWFRVPGSAASTGA